MLFLEIPPRCRVEIGKNLIRISFYFKPYILIIHTVCFPSEKSKDIICTSSPPSLYDCPVFPICREPTLSEYMSVINVMTLIFFINYSERHMASNSPQNTSCTLWTHLPHHACLFLKHSEHLFFPVSLIVLVWLHWYSETIQNIYLLLTFWLLWSRSYTLPDPVNKMGDETLWSEITVIV